MTPNLKELLTVFLRLGITSFGGPLAHIALMEEEFVRRRQWLAREEFSELIALTNLIPGPNSTEVALHIGYKRGGWKGFFVAGLAFILPAVLLVMLLAWFYVEYGDLPKIQSVFYFVKPVVVAIILLAIWNLAKSILAERNSKMFFVFTLVLVFFGMQEIFLLLIAGFAFVLIWKWEKNEGKFLPAIAYAASGSDFQSLYEKATHPVSYGTLFLSFVKVGSLIYGSGYVLIAYLNSEFGAHLGWLNDTQILDAISVGQITPGPLFTTATFLGFVMASWGGAILATLGIFIPAFIFVALTIRYWPQLKEKVVVQKFVRGVTIASLALMFSVSFFLIGDVMNGLVLPVLCLVSFVLLKKYRLPSYYLIGGAIVLGLCF